MANEPANNGNIMDSLFGDGTKSQDASNPTNALKSCVNFGFFSALTGTVLDTVSNISDSLSGGLAGIGGADGGQTMAQNLNLNSIPTLGGMNGMKIG